MPHLSANMGTQTPDEHKKPHVVILGAGSAVLRQRVLCVMPPL